MGTPVLEPEPLKDAPLRYAPTNELGVVFLFSHLCKRMQLHIESIQAAFPDCIARQRVGGKERRIRIEFEYRSSNFRAHRHSVDGCDWIVCWEDDWPDVPASIKVVELRQFFGAVFNVWVLVLPPKEDWPAEGKYGFGKRVTKGDLVLVYEWSPKMWFRQVYAVVGECEPPNKDGRYGRKAQLHSKYNIVERGEPVLFGRYVHRLRRVCILQHPLTRKSLATDKLIHGDPVFSQKANRKITEHWWRIYERIVRKNPDCIAVLEPFSPSKV